MASSSVNSDRGTIVNALLELLAQQRIEDIGSWAVHPGGPRILDAVEESLCLPRGTLDVSREVLADCGNMSSPTCLFVLERALRAGDLRAGEPAVVTALGPGFASELVLMESLSD